jgi:SAM-dependent methyltransferase
MTHTTPDGPAGRRETFDLEQYGDAYPPGIEAHYWHQARNAIILGKLRSLTGLERAVLDVGCGAGITVAHLRAHGIESYGVEAGQPEHVVAGASAFVQTGTHPADFRLVPRERIGTVLLLDVIEHVEVPEALIGQCLRDLPAARHLLVTVPARTEIWSVYDEHYGHRRRYDLDALAQLASRCGLDYVTGGYFFHALYLAARLLKALDVRRETQVDPPRLPPLHRLLGAAFVLEERLLPGQAPGSSAYAVLRRR